MVMFCNFLICKFRLLIKPKYEMKPRGSVAELYTCFVFTKLVLMFEF